MKYIGILGGAFSPPHRSHKAIADACIKNKFVDEVWILPAYNHVEKKNIIATFEQRLKMCKIMLGGFFSKVKVKDFEKLNTKGTTSNLLQIIKEKFPSHRFAIIIGEDCADNIDTWFDYKSLIKNYSFIVFKREDYHNFKPKKWYRESPHKFVLIKESCYISSSFIRKLFRKGHFKLVKLLINEKLFKYIMKEKIDYENSTD